MFVGILVMIMFKFYYKGKKRVFYCREIILYKDLCSEYYLDDVFDKLCLEYLRV